MKKRQSITTGALLITAIIIVVNIISYTFFFRLDLTRDKRYTLSDATLNLLKDLKQPVTVTAYFSENMPPQIEECRKQFKDLLSEYAARSGNKVVYNFINPNKSDSLEKEAAKNGIEPKTINIREKDEMKAQRAFLGAVIKYGEKTEVLPFIQPGGPTEFELSTSIKKLTLTKKPFVGYLQGNGEPPMQAMQQVNAQLNIEFNYQNVNLGDSNGIPADCKAIVMVDPKDTFKANQLKALDDYMARGGHLFVAYSGLNADLQGLRGAVLNIGLTPWLAKQGIILEPKFIIDASCGDINLPENFNGQEAYQKVKFPFLPIITNLSSHPITEGLSSFMLPFAAQIKFSGDTNKVKLVEIAHTSEKTGLLPAPVTFDVHHQWVPEEFPLTHLPVAVAISGIGGNKDAKIVVIGCGSFAVNGTGQRATQQDDDNIDLLVNSVDWLADDTGLIELRSKMIRTAPLKDISDSAKQILRYLNFLLPILLVIVYGFVRFQMKRRLRIKRMEETYDKEA